MQTLMTVCYGDDPLYKLELFGSVLSALSLSQDDIQIVIFTDNDLSDFHLPVRIHDIGRAKELSKQDGESIAHGVKEFCMMEALDFYQTPVLYFDTDILFKQPPTQLLSKVSPTNILMNADEGKISDYPEWDFLSDYIENSLEPNELGLSRNSPMYNSGIVGLCPEHRQAIERSIQLTRVLYKQDPVFNIEQFSTGVLLAEKSQVHFCIDDVFHYWGWRRKFVHLELQRFRAKYEGCSGAALIQAYRSDPPRMIPSIHFNDRVENRIKALLTGWDADYEFASLCYLSALRIGDEDSQLANAWIKTCLDAIAKFVGNGESKSHAFNFEKDFSLIMPDSGRQLSWLDQALQTQFLQLGE